MGNAKSRAAKREASKQQEEANVAAAGSSAAPAPIAPGSKQPLTDVERTAVGVSWLRWQASKAISTKGHTPPSADGEAQPLYDGSFDEKLCEDLTEVDAAFLAQRDKNLRFGPHVVAVRTVALDDALMRATGGPAPPAAPDGPAPRQPLAVSSFPTGGVRQVAILGAGLDARAWRLPWPEGVTVFEVDSGSVEALKQRKFGRVPTRSAARHALVADLNDLQQVRDKLAGAGFKASEPTAWVLEGLIGYLTREAGLALLRELKAQSVPGSYLLLTCPPTPEEKRASDQEGWKLYHAHFEEPEDTHKRVVEAGWATAELITTERLQEVYGIECKQPQVHAIA